MSKVKFITFEGVDGAGKSTHLERFVSWLRERGIEVVLTREPGGTPLGERLRDILLNHPMHPETEAMLMFAARREHVEQVIRPALSRGAWVVSDRFSDASFAYQGGGRNVPVAYLEQLEQLVHADLQPDLTFLFDLPTDIAMSRIAGTRELDRFEQEKQDFHERVRAAYLARTAKSGGRIRIIDSNRKQEEIWRDVERVTIQELVD